MKSPYGWGICYIHKAARLWLGVPFGHQDAHGHITTILAPAQDGQRGAFHEAGAKGIPGAQRYAKEGRP